ncbi:pseudouridine synthase [Mycena albidolilacea]|uniref:21S rRNA pseudouridine(2819) synthase n=1 Tax=Mycena albidolilacea TaxID=1033008 RepID=A0AAD7EX18_9AGAR|nr:pseudouridine synthase [Mycena albidolilacea]
MDWRQKLAKTSFRWSDRVLYVDRGVIVMNKPPGLVTQLDPSTTNTEGGNLAKLLDDLKQGLELVTPPHRVHRLDKGTTGSLVLARSLNVAHDLSGQFQRRTVDKTYLALVRGGSRSFPQTSGQIRTFLEFPNGRASLVPQGQLPKASEPKESQTDWELVASSPHLPLSLVRLKLLTGHKHQIRVHLAQVLKTPILGDTLHSQSQPTDEIRDTFQLPDDRMFLHASQISFFRYRPVGGKKRFKIRVCAPLPQDLVEICSEAGIPIGDEERLGGLFKSESGKEQDFHPVADGEIPDINGCWIPQRANEIK